MRLHSKAVAVLILLLLMFVSVSPIISCNNQNVKNTNDFVSMSPPTRIHTYLSYDSKTGIILLEAEIYPSHPTLWVNETFYFIDSGDKIIYTEPFKFPEGTHLLEYGSVANEKGLRDFNFIRLTYDSTPPTVEITSPELGGIYFRGNMIFNFGSRAVCIGNVPIVVQSNDGDGYGVDKVFFTIENDTGYDSTPPYEYTYKGTHFGELKITVTACDYKGLMSEPDEITIIVFCL